MQRQEVYAKSFMNTVLSKTKRDLGVPVSLFNSTSPYSCTNLNPAKITVLAKEAVTGGGMSFDIEMVKGKSEMLDETHAKYTVDEEAFFEQFLSVYYEKVNDVNQITGQS
ncbi:MAG: hypothetical protein U0P28_10700, partial [Ruminococcus sp.]